MKRRTLLRLGLAAGVSVGTYGLLSADTSSLKQPHMGQVLGAPALGALTLGLERKGYLVPVTGEAGYHVWTPTVLQNGDSWWLFYGRWPAKLGPGGWRQTTGGFAIAASPAGPFGRVALMADRLRPADVVPLEIVSAALSSGRVRCSPMRNPQRRDGAWFGTVKAVNDSTGLSYVLVMRSESDRADDPDGWHVWSILGMRGRGLEDSFLYPEGAGWAVLCHPIGLGTIVKYRLNAGGSGSGDPEPVADPSMFGSDATSVEMPWLTSAGLYCGVRLGGNVRPHTMCIGYIPHALER